MRYALCIYNKNGFFSIKYRISPKNIGPSVQVYFFGEAVKHDELGEERVVVQDI
jgi:hypothetical protein